MIQYSEPLIWTYLTEAIKASPTLDTYYLMFTTDETIASAVGFLTYNVFSFWGDYVNPRKELTDFVNANFENLAVSLESTLHKVVENAIVYGYCVSELVWKRKNGNYYLERIVPLHPLMTEYVYDEKNKVKGVQYISDQGVVELPLEKCFIFKLGSCLKGESRLRTIYRLYALKRGFLMFWATAMERYAMPLIHFHAENVDESKLTQAASQLRNVWSNGVISTTGEGVRLELLEPSQNVSQNFIDAIEYLNTLIYRGLLLPQLLMSARTTGTYALGKVHFDLFSMAAKRITKRLAEAVVDQIVAKILDYNYDDIGHYGEIVVTEQPSSDERFKLSQSFLNLINAGIIDPVTDNEWIRNMLKFPIIESEDEE